jgi:uncharacterized protein YuzE
VQPNAVTSVYQPRVTDNAGRTYLIRAIVSTEIAPRGRRDGASYERDRQVLAAAMKVTYDPDVDVLRITLTDSAVIESDEERPGIILDFDADGNVVGLEILEVSKQVDNPKSVNYAITA